MKRRTKEQREQQARAALRQRVEDIAVGAAGYDFKHLRGRKLTIRYA